MRALLLLLAAAPSWKLLEKSDGFELYEREVAGERVVELKVVTVSKLPIDTLCTAAFGGTALDPAEPEVTARSLVSYDGGVLICYEQVSAPVVSDRDYVVRTVRESLPNGGCGTRFEAANQYAPKLPDGFVRIEKLRGHFTFEPQPGSSGNVLVTYTIFTDPGGSIPAVFVEGPRKKSALKWVKMVLARAEKAQRASALSRDGGLD